MEVLKWLQINMITPPNLFVHHNCWTNEVRSKKLRSGFWLVWHVVTCVTSKERNDKIFNNGVCEEDGIVEKIKVLS